ncbi:hypothetical protein Tco_1261880 [Tanacetum coccineum]
MPPIDDAKLGETMAKYYPDLVCKYYPDHPSYTPPPSSKPFTPPTIEESLAKLGDSIDKLELVTKRLVAKCLTASTTSLISITSQTTFTKNESNDHTSNTKTDEIAILSRHSPLTRVASSNTIATIHVLDMLTNPPKQTDALPLHRLSPKEIQIIHSHGLCFHCPETFHLNRMCLPKFVFLQSKPEPPWKPHDTRYTTMSLEDKTHFQERSIDTCKQLKTKSS